MWISRVFGREILRGVYELRELVMNELMKNPERLGVRKLRKS